MEGERGAASVSIVEAEVRRDDRLIDGRGDAIVDIMSVVGLILVDRSLRYRRWTTSGTCCYQ